jgi:hypothetical protein
MTAPTFVKFEDLVLAPPLPALVSLLMTGGVSYLGWLLASRLRRGQSEALDIAAGFVVSAATIAALVHALALAQLSTVAVLRPLGWALAVLGAFAAVRMRTRITGAVRREAAQLWDAAPFERVTAILTVLTILGLGAAALGPPTDPDSINYHLGIPLDWLRHGGAYARTDWFCERLIGVAEALNLLGLAAGTDSLGACMQLGGLIGAAVALRALAAAPSDRLLAWLLVAACPMMAFLVPNQKPMMLPIAASTIAIVLAVRRFSDFRSSDAMLVFGCAGFAAASKLSFLLSVGFIVLIGLTAAHRSGRLLSCSIIAATAFGALMLPVLGRNYVFFGDPISPFLERFRHPPDATLLQWSHYLRTASGEATLGNLLLLPVRILGTVHPGHITTVLGLGALAFIPALGVRGAPRLLLYAALAAALASVALGQIAPRFLTESYLWAGGALVAAQGSRLKTLLRRGLTLQCGLAAAVALFGAWNLFPGALTARQRTMVLERSAAGYTEQKWLDQVLPPDAVVIDPGLYHTFTPRPFVVPDPLSIEPPQAADRALAGLVGTFGANTVVIGVNDEDTALSRLTRRCGQSLGPPGSFALAMRNPFNAHVYQLQAFRLRNCYPAPVAGATK